MYPLHPIVTFFVYGLAFFILGIIIFVYPKSGSRFKLAESLGLIALFGISHGINEWMYMFIFMQSAETTLFRIVRLLTLPASFFFLVLFGVKAITEKKGKNPVLKAIPVILIAAWAAFTALSDRKFLTGELAARYIIGNAGIFLTCWGLVLQIPEMRALGQKKTVLNLKLTVGAFIIYGFLASLIVPEAKFFPASVLNYRVFFAMTGIPVQDFRTVCAIVLFFAITRILKVFEWETVNSLREAHDKLEERVRERTEALNKSNEQLLNSLNELKRAEGALRESEERLALAQKAGHVGVFDWDLVGGRIVWTEQLEQLFGLSTGDFEGNYEGWTRRLYPDDAQRLNTFFKEWMKSGRDEEHWESRFFRPDGEMRWMESRGRIISAPSGSPLRVIGVSVDVTERKSFEEKITALNEELKRNIVQLQAANRELEAFSYSVSHDLRAPLRHLTGFVELLVKRTGEGLDEKSRHYLEVISRAASQMGRLIDDLLGFSRAGRVEMKREQVDSGALVREAIRELGNEAKGRNVIWEIQTLPAVFGDPALLRLIWINLISNALKFTRPLKRVLIKIGTEDSDGEYIFFVKDNGVGFDMKYKDKLFGLFQRLHRTEEFEGTGVGLANVQRIVQRHGGRNWAESSPGEGTTFYFSLPKKRSKGGHRQ